uniref:Brix domain-containing protein n=1 Tax=Chromera velia CCMP2878 TaxID=1169474 RepID=A0A0G4GHQ3_9ALVE|mmetsp:Transcript_41172/g.81176  ORF Transcript_41172/g.81176 Transcript_41172/m.81176 type:complete len:328 (+) Transcript_41172:155-1138(+)|eukprot:Cvel_21918.t1-p1 / transcript=Cvel_21918.t1 / gene=Cvel_21918 / organism=Chromera_velia_CCMP2878 / gene_product=Brix domain-containing protein F44G4.1, putative / transcript_product=Brix domain-containing protein F44G4.1, putative / location=Cvel_scaffold2101:5757-9458(-) / protein_length=327 / sequence_SO=supercontig / SO=protein_coding / is_pseudo=false
MVKGGQKGGKGGGERKGDSKAVKKDSGKKKAVREANDIKNKDIRSRVSRKQKEEAKKEKREARKARKEAEARGEKVERQAPRTIESMRRTDDSMVVEGDEEVAGEDAVDEFSAFFRGETTPKLMVTTCKNPSEKMEPFLKEFVLIMPNAHYYKRGDYPLKKIVKYATNKNFTDLVVFIEKKKKIHGMYISHLPEGPTSYFRITSLQLAEDIKGGAKLTDHDPELVLNNFDTRLGHRIGRQLAALFPQKPEFLGRRVIAFHNQRDFLFFRHYRYVFKANGERCALQEIGPRFTLKLRFLHAGTFDTVGGEYEYLWRPDLQVDRKRFFM